jgi:D-alanyl-D-alanine carboxypeptidase
MTKQGVCFVKIFRHFFCIILLAGSLALGCTGDKKPLGTRDRTEPRYLHPLFSLDRERLAGLIAGLPSPSREAILAAPEEFLEGMERLLLDSPSCFQAPDDLLVLVDKHHPLPEGWEPGDLVNLRNYPSLRLSRPNLQMRALVTADLLAMNEAAKTDGVILLLSSTYRSAA